MIVLQQKLVMWSFIMVHKAGVASELEVWYLAVNNLVTTIKITARFNLNTFANLG